MQDELMGQVYNGVISVKLQVMESDFEQAIEILKEIGYFKKPNRKPNFMDKILSKASI